MVTTLRIPSRPANHLLSGAEREYLSTLKKKERKRILRFIDDKTLTEPLRLRLLKSYLPDAYKRYIFELLKDDDSDKHINLARNALKLPFGLRSPPVAENDAGIFLRRAEEVMERNITGHMTAKREVLTLLAQWFNGGGMPYAIAIEGPPGIGKSTFVKTALATAMQRPIATTCLGGASDASFLQGHGFTYEGAKHGRLAECLMENKTMDGILFFDELDKISNTYRGDEIVNTLIHLTDPVQPALRDRYFQGLEIPFSECIKVFAYNDARKVNPILRDRLKRIRMDVPDRTSKVEIARRHLVPAVQRSVNSTLFFSDECIECVVDRYREEPGMRRVEQTIHHIFSTALMCQQYGSQRVAGLDDVPFQKIDVPFVQALLSARTADANDAPPALMYS